VRDGLYHIYQALDPCFNLNWVDARERYSRQLGGCVEKKMHLTRLLPQIVGRHNKLPCPRYGSNGCHDALSTLESYMLIFPLSLHEIPLICISNTTIV